MSARSQSPLPCRFQFLEGAIKGSVECTLKNSLRRFQFLEGAIKGHQGRNGCLS